MAVTSPDDLVDKFYETLDLKHKHPWDWDQIILTRIVLENRLCSTRETNTVWGAVKLKPEAFDDAGVCFRGQKEYGNCYSSGYGGGFKWKGCKWWHFTPQNTAETLLKKFEWLKTYRGPMD